jgi:hypothetical protein
MGDYDERIEHAIRNTVVLRPPTQALSTFGTTNVYYYLLSEPSYADLIESEDETVVREGRVLSERPRVVTPTYLVNLEGFSEHARRYLEMITQQHGPHAPGLFYGYKNEPKSTNVVSTGMQEVVHKLEEEIEKEGKSLTTIIRGVDELWDVSLMKFIFEMTSYSAGSNAYELGRKGLLSIDSSGLPMDARLTIEHLFDLVNKGDLDPGALKMELDRWDVFEEYQDRFLRLFKR